MDATKINILTQTNVISNFYFISLNAVSNVCSSELSQVKMLAEKNYELTIDELVLYFEQELPDGQINTK